MLNVLTIPSSTSVVQTAEIHTEWILTLTMHVEPCSSRNSGRISNTGLTTNQLGIFHFIQYIAFETGANTLSVLGELP